METIYPRPSRSGPLVPVRTPRTGLECLAQGWNSLHWCSRVPVCVQVRPFRVAYVHTRRNRFFYRVWSWQRRTRWVDGNGGGSDDNQQHLLPVFPNISAFLSRTNATVVIYHCLRAAARARARRSFSIVLATAILSRRDNEYNLAQSNWIYYSLSARYPSVLAFSCITFYLPIF